jgi:hypothetical protein
VDFHAAERVRRGSAHPGTKEHSRAPGGLFFRPFLLAEQKKATQGAGAEPPAISFSKSKAAFRRLLVIQGLDPRLRGDDTWILATAGMTTMRFAGMTT